jgi:hypothetical protein
MMDKQTVIRCMQLRLSIPKEKMAEMRGLMRECARARTGAMQQWRAADADKRIGVPDDPPVVKKGPYKGKVDYKALYGPCPKLSLYRSLTQRFPSLATGILSAIDKEVGDKYRRNRISILLGRAMPPGWLDTAPIPLRGQDARVVRIADGRFAVRCNFYAKKMGRKQIDIPIRSDPERLPQAWRDTLDGLAAGKLKRRGLLIHCRGTRLKRKWYVDVPYEIGVEQPKIIDGRVLQVRRPIDGNGFLRCRWQPKRGAPRSVDIEYQSALPIGERNEFLRKSMQHKYRCHREKSGRRGHGRKRAVEPFRKLTTKRENQQKAFNQNAARYILNMARRWRCGTIELEDLSKVPDTTTLVLGSWPYFQIKQRLSDLCDEHGLGLKVVEPIEVITERLEDGNEDEAKEKGRQKVKRKGKAKRRKKSAAKAYGRVDGRGA